MRSTELYCPQNHRRKERRKWTLMYKTITNRERASRNLQEFSEFIETEQDGEKYKPHQGRPHHMTRSHTVAAQGNTTEGNYRDQEKADDTTSSLLQSHLLLCVLLPDADCCCLSPNILLADFCTVF